MRQPHAGDRHVKNSPAIALGLKFVIPSPPLAPQLRRHSLQAGEGIPLSFFLVVSSAKTAKSSRRCLRRKTASPPTSTSRSHWRSCKAENRNRPQLLVPRRVALATARWPRLDSRE